MLKKRTLKRPPKQYKPKPRKIARPTEPENPSCYCYMVECSDGTLYTGWTTNTERRVKVHNAGRGARYTSMRRPVKLVYVEPQPDRISAMKRERAIKALPRRKKQALIQTMLAQPN